MAWYQSDLQKSQSAYIPPEWSTGTDEEIVEALEKHYAGEVDLHDYWSVGDERTVHVAAIEAVDDGLNPSIKAQSAQDVTLIILDTAPRTLTTAIGNVTESAFIIGVKNRYISGTSSSSEIQDFMGITTRSWGSSDFKKWLENKFDSALPSVYQGMFKRFTEPTCVVKTERWSSTTVFYTTELGNINNVKYIAPNAKEIKGSGVSVESTLSQLEYFKTSANRISYVYDPQRNIALTSLTVVSNVSTLPDWYSYDAYDNALETNVSIYSVNLVFFGVI